MSDFLPSTEKVAKPSPSRTMTDVLSLPDSERNLVNWIMRQGQATLAQCIEKFQQPSEDLQTMLSHLHKEGFLKRTDKSTGKSPGNSTGDSPGDNASTEATVSVYAPAMRTRRNRQVPKKIWDALG